MNGGLLAGARVFGSLLGDGHWETCAACINAWQNWARRVKYERTAGCCGVEMWAV